MHQVMHLNKDMVFPLNRDDDKDVWILDTGASNYMTGSREALASLDTSVQCMMLSEMGHLLRSRASVQ
jgi:hypothetical protein